MFEFFKSKRKGRAAILMYHRINTAVSDSWQLCVSPQYFKAQMDVLKRYDVVPLQEIADAARRGKLEKNKVAITFDDGYLDNLQNAAPVLAAYNYPATFFITNAALANAREYWWDELEFLLLEVAEAPAAIALHVNGETLQWNISGHWSTIISQEEVASYASWLPWAQPPSARHALFIFLSIYMKALLPDTQRSVMDQLYAQWQLTPVVRDGYRVMTVEQLGHLCAHSRFEVGGHSAEHTALANFEKEIQFKAISENKNFLHKLTDKEVSGYCYAHGSYNTAAQEVLQQLAFKYACTTENAIIQEQCNPFVLPRLHVKNMNGDAFGQMLNNCFTQ